jgi:AcrR family transcriptional regulator
MAKTTKTDFSHAKQKRSEKTLDDLLDAALEIVEGAKPEKFTSRTLAEKSGYSLGTLIKRLGSIENVFLWAINKGREKHFENFAEIIAAFDSNRPLNEFIEMMTDEYIAAIQKVSSKVMRYFERRSIAKDDLSFNPYHYTDVLVIPYLKIVKRNKTQTFRDLSEDEVTLIFRAIYTMLVRPYIESNPIAGTREHRRIVVENITRLLGK